MIINGGIVTYNPDIEKLKKNISRIAGQVCKLVIADNGSKNIEDIKRLAAAFENVSVILNYENFGIARALNQIMKWSSNNGGDWTITLDQDSECSDCIIDLYKPYLNKEDVGMLTCRYTDRNLNEENVVYNSDCEEIDFCITSASLLKNECWKKTAGFDEYLFIDKVDNDICLKLQENGSEKTRTIATRGVCDRYMISFLTALSYTENCYSCKYAQEKRPGDITLGDSWGTELPENEWKKGISLILCQTEKGITLSESANVKIVDVNVDKAKSHNHQLEHPSKAPKSREKFIKHIKHGMKFNRAVLLALPKDCGKQAVKEILIKCKLLAPGGVTYQISVSD